MSFPVLYHFTCRHGAREIGASGILRPWANPAIALLPPLVWMTDMPTANALSLGLESDILKCDRTAVRYRVQDGVGAQWLSFLASLRPRPAALVASLLHGAGRMPDRWWVSTTDVTAVRS